MKADKHITQKELQEDFMYIDGKLYRSTGWWSNQGYHSCKYKNKSYLTHRLIYILHYGKIAEGLVIDHINGDTHDNRIENLRAVTRQENSFNTNRKGIMWNKRNNNWRVRIGLNYKRIEVGSFKTREEAEEAYSIAKEKLHRVEEH
jgi:hypothetical protein